MKHFTFDNGKARIPELERILACTLEIHDKAESKAQRIRRIENDCSDPVQLEIERSQLQFMVKSIRENLQQIADLSALSKPHSPDKTGDSQADT